MRISIIITLLILSGCSHNKSLTYTTHVKSAISMDDIDSVFLKVSNDEKVRFFGYVNFDGLGNGQGNMGYPGLGPGVYLVSILTHAAISESSKNSEKNKRQNQANTVLVPYRSLISDVDIQSLMNNVIRDLSKGSTHKIYKYEAEEELGRWILTSIPVFYMTQDESHIILRNVVTLYNEGDPDTVVYQNMVEVISQPVKEDPRGFWIGNSGVEFNKVTNELLLTSFRLVNKDFRGVLTKIENKDRTFKYLLSGEKIFERGSLLATDCGRVTIRTLRGWLKSVPMVRDVSKLTAENICDIKYSHVL